MNVGPTADGRIIPLFEERLRQMGMSLVDVYQYSVHININTGTLTI